MSGSTAWPLCRAIRARARSREILESFRIARLARPAAWGNLGWRAPASGAGPGTGDPSASTAAGRTADRPGCRSPKRASWTTSGRGTMPTRAFLSFMSRISGRRSFALGENAIVLDAGRIVAQGPPHEVLGRPTSETIAQLAGFENVFECMVVGQHPEQGTMTCRISGSTLEIEAPLSRVDSDPAPSAGNSRRRHPGGDLSTARAQRPQCAGRGDHVSAAAQCAKVLAERELRGRNSRCSSLRGRVNRKSGGRCSGFGWW